MDRHVRVQGVVCGRSARDEAGGEVGHPIPPSVVGWRELPAAALPALNARWSVGSTVPNVAVAWDALGVEVQAGVVVGCPRLLVGVNGGDGCGVLPVARRAWSEVDRADGIRGDESMQSRTLTSLLVRLE